jgi:hypothetical protein
MLDERIGHFRDESAKHKKLYRLTRYTVFSLTACSTILASFALTFVEFQTWFNLAVILTTAASGVVTSIEGLRKPAELWILERNVFYTLNDLKRELEYNSAYKAQELNADEYFQRMQEVLNATSDKWSRQVKPAPQPNA